ncbi:MAG TPA: septum site-determining protein Ssd [Mycobacteriales bacterium]|nr:septum site-determining protein Ssd [Mycobacteriales bacterium]
MTRQNRPLLLTADTELLDELLGLAAAAGVAVDVAAEPTACRPQWTDSPLVLVGADVAPGLPSARFEPRFGVLLVARGSPPDDLREIATIVHADEVIGLPDGESTILERLADVTEPAAQARVIGVVGGRGGAGTSILAAGLALTAATRGPAWLIDLDPLGGGSDAGLGAELRTGARWSDLGVLTGRLSPAALRGAVPQVHGVAVVATTDPLEELRPDAVRAVISAAGRGLGVVVLDLARYPTAGRDAAVATVDDLLVVVPAELRAVLAARRVLGRLGPTPAVPRAVVRSAADVLPTREVVRGVGLPFAGELPDEPRVREAAQLGDAPGLLRGTKLADLCSTVLDRSLARAVAA